ncbi:hypothetical protein J8I26_22405, partial [Herbaspirillum sp. LeCh32-8]|uniref:hypothetical protein n=1 Tax=Herbaspirillum sp. LeCh32-8 TaxID=2821356 RepID=UPI001AE8AAB7
MVPAQYDGLMTFGAALKNHKRFPKRKLFRIDTEFLLRLFSYKREARIGKLTSLHQANQQANGAMHMQPSFT